MVMFSTLRTKLGVSMSCLLSPMGILLTVARRKGTLGRIEVDSNDTMLGYFDTEDSVNKVSI